MPHNPTQVASEVQHLSIAGLPPASEPVPVTVLAPVEDARPVGPAADVPLTAAQVPPERVMRPTCSCGCPMTVTPRGWRCPFQLAADEQNAALTRLFDDMARTHAAGATGGGEEPERWDGQA